MFETEKVSLRKPHGHFIHCGQTVDTMQCVHCGRHDAWIKGSGRKRAYCGKCDGWTCTKRECIENCVPIERQIENIEAGRSVLTPRRTQILIP